MPTKKSKTPPPEGYKKVRTYNGPAKGSDEAKQRMARVRAAQYAKNNLVYGTQGQQDDTTE